MASNNPKKVVKVLRLVKTFQYFHELRMMLNMLVGSMRSLFWCLLMLTCILYTWSILLMQMLAMYLDDPESYQMSLRDREALIKMFGTVGATCVTLVQATTGGRDWNEVYNLLDTQGYALSAAFLIYVLFVMIVAWNVITGTFLQQAMSCAQPEMDRLVYEGLKERRRLSRHLKKIFSKATDENLQGRISLHTLQHKLQNDIKLRYALANHGLSINVVEHFLEMMGDLTEEGDAQMKIDTLVNACVRMRGYATSVDLHELSYGLSGTRKHNGIHFIAFSDFIQHCRSFCTFAEFEKAINRRLDSFLVPPRLQARPIDVPAEQTPQGPRGADQTRRPAGRSPPFLPLLSPSSPPLPSTCRRCGSCGPTVYLKRGNPNTWLLSGD